MLYSISRPLSPPLTISLFQAMNHTVRCALATSAICHLLSLLLQLCLLLLQFLYVIFYSLSLSLSLAITEPLLCLLPPLPHHPRCLSKTFILFRNLILFHFASRFVFISVPRRSFFVLLFARPSPLLHHSVLFYTL